ncbi:MAG: NusA N-terminal domain-containing protein, partial [Methylomonas sp.]
MANKEILLVADVFANEKEIDKELIFQAIESALEAATIKRYENPIKVRVSINRHTGDYLTYRRWLVVEPNADINGDVEFPGWQILLEAAQMDVPEIKVGEYIEEEIESVE